MLSWQALCIAALMWVHQLSMYSSSLQFFQSFLPLRLRNTLPHFAYHPSFHCDCCPCPSCRLRQPLRSHPVSLKVSHQRPRDDKTFFPTLNTSSIVHGRWLSWSGFAILSLHLILLRVMPCSPNQNALLTSFIDRSPWLRSPAVTALSAR